ncbi:MAG: fumarylacetoacetate hydrolase family protein [Ignavibacteria bacterium]|jgi:5-carboxymethyl-2-hydroxymuconate isomerase
MAELKVKNSKETIRVENVYCIGKNYLEHIREFDTASKKDEVPEEPVIFLKPNTSVEMNPDKVSIPVFKGKGISDNLQNEIELVIIIGKDGVDIPLEEAYEYIFGYAVGIDFTLRDVQTAFKQKGLPWTLSKGFLGAAPVSDVVKAEDIDNPHDLMMRLKINRDVKQDANTSSMIFEIDYIIYYISCIFGLKRGDLIFTGTPAGIMRLNKGDLIEAEIEKIGKLKIKVV